MVCYDGPYKGVQAHSDTSSYTLDIFLSMNIFPMFHVSLLKPYRHNPNDTFPGQKLKEPSLVISADGAKQWFVEKILDCQRCGREY
jgi:hypothetical protein